MVQLQAMRKFKKLEKIQGNHNYDIPTGVVMEAMFGSGQLNAGLERDGDGDGEIRLHVTHSLSPRVLVTSPVNRLIYQENGNIEVLTLNSTYLLVVESL